MVPEILKEYGIFVSAAIALVAAFWTYRASMKSLKASPYDALASRVTSLEDKVVALEADNESLKKANELMRKETEIDRALITKLIKLLEEHNIEVPKSWLPTWWPEI